MNKFAIIDEEVVEVEVLSLQQNYALVRKFGRTQYETKYGDQPVKATDLFNEKVDALTEVCARLKKRLKTSMEPISVTQPWPFTKGVHW